jgi:GntR family transcriptional regulator/MocR family aminotransferase
VDELGLRTHLLPREEKPKLVLVTPSHQFPLGGVLPIQRRIELLQFAREMDCWIVEDDYDSEFRFQGGPISSLQGLDPERVFYIGTFSKILSPAFRIGYLVLPSDWVEPCCDRKGLDDLHTTWIEQLVLAKFIELGHLERHIARMKKCYRQRRDVLKQCLKAAFSERVTVQGDSTGLHLVAEFRDVEFSEAVLRSLEAGGVKIYPVEHYAIVKGKHLHRIVLGYGNLTPEAIALGVNRLAAILGCSNSFEKE